MNNRIYQSGENQAPIANVGKTGFYITRSGSNTIYRFPKSHTLPSGETIEGLTLPHTFTKRIRRAYRSKYSPHVGEKQRAKLRA